ncbi:MAG: DUF1573 domain-containing protein [Flavobacteriaceae bacterium]|jgi:hypothetical protein|nr:DUF1573 domain-containing protein [Flavobacteriaceae bacterium]
MKKTVLILALAIFACGFQSCEKKQEHNHSKEYDEAVEKMNQEQKKLAKEAQNMPLTSLALSENSFDFGSIKRGEKKEHKYEVTNTGKNPLIISAVKPGCGCTVPDYTKDPILPGEKGEITLNFDSSSFDGSIHKQAQIYANVEQAPITISFTGIVVK